MTNITGRRTAIQTYAVAPASTQSESDPGRIVALALLSVRFIQGFIYWGGGSRRFIYEGMIANEFPYNRFAPGPFGLSAKMGAQATITLPGIATAGPDIPAKAATLRLRTVNGNSFELPVKARF